MKILGVDYCNTYCPKALAPAGSEQGWNPIPDSDKGLLPYCLDGCKNPKKPKHCLGCNDLFTPRNNKQVHCPKCEEFLAVASSVKAAKFCSVCGKEFTPTHGKQGKCEDCRSAKEKKSVHCENCNEEFFPRKGQVLCKTCLAFAKTIAKVRTPIQCEKCRSEFVPTHGKQKVCPDCKPVVKKFEEIQCEACGKMFLPKRKKQTKCADCRSAVPMKKEIPCEVCGKDFLPKTKRSKICPECKGVKITPALEPRICVCGKQFLPSRKNQWICDECKSKPKKSKKDRPATLKVCENCGRTFEATHGKTKFCLDPECKKARAKEYLLTAKNKAHFSGMATVIDGTDRFGNGR